MSKEEKMAAMGLWLEAAGQKVETSAWMQRPVVKKQAPRKKTVDERRAAYVRGYFVRG